MMLKPILQPLLCGRPFILLILSFSLLAPARGEELPWQSRLSAIVDGEELDAPAQLEAETRLLMQLLENGWEADAAGWEWTVSVLERWESSPRLDAARTAYLDILDGIGRSRVCRDQPLPEEGDLRTFLQRGLAVSDSPVREGALLFHLAESWLRSPPASPTVLRRVEGLLQQALSVLDDRRPADAAHLRLGNLHWEWGRQSEVERDSRANGSHYTQAVYHFAAVRDMEDARPEWKEEAAAALDSLLRTELEVRVDNRFLPHEETRILLSGRNIEAVELLLVGLPLEQQGQAHSLSGLRALLAGPDFTPEQLLLQEAHRLNGRHPHDWRDQELQLGEGLPGGWYGVTARGAGIEAQTLLLVSPLEVVALPRGDDSWLIWVADGESGHPAAGAQLAFLDASGSLLGTLETDLDGQALVTGGPLAEWREVHITAESNPAYLRRDQSPARSGDLPWVVANPPVMPNGSVLQWGLLGVNPPQSLTIELADGTTLTSDASAAGRGWSLGRLPLPDTPGVAGPVWAHLPNDTRLHLAHLRPDRSLPLQLDFIGEALLADANLFLASTQLAIQVAPAFGSSDRLPEFIRLRVSTDFRPPYHIGGESVPPNRVLHEAILPFAPRHPAATVIELPEIAATGEILPLRVEISGLDTGERLGEAVYGLAPFKRTVQVSSAEQLLREGEALKVRLRAAFAESPVRESLEGELVIYRETWENRYIHRKRGTPLAESAYLALPDRSLLGAAKTDYRLDEQGFVREEIRRVPIRIDTPTAEASVPFERPGHYQIELEINAVDTQAAYPEGPVELWVIPEDSGELRAFRGSRPRMITEAGRDGELEVLVLADRRDATLLVDLSWPDGEGASRVIQMAEAAEFIVFGDRQGAAPPLCRAVLAGERRTDFLWATLRRDAEAAWELGAEGLFGLSPGATFNWPVTPDRDRQSLPLLWTIYPQAGNPLIPERLRWQRQLHARLRQAQPAPADWLGRHLPLPLPFASAGGGPAGQAAPASYALTDPVAFLELYPEATRRAPAVVEAAPFRPLQAEAEAAAEGAQLSVRGTFPEQAGRWSLALVGMDANRQLQSQLWPLSTELPILGNLDGPARLRVGDHADFYLTVENRTRRQARVELEIAIAAGLDAPAVPPDWIDLPPFERERIAFAARAVHSGDSLIEGVLTSAGTFAQLTQPVQVVSDGKPVSFQFIQAPAQMASQALRVNVADISEGELLASAGLGPLLPVLWTHLRAAEDQAEPLLATIGDWALARVMRHHGIPFEAAGEVPLDELLTRFQVESGGWKWVEGAAADPWLSALVLWSVELFARPDDEKLAAVRESGRQYLESLLVRDEVDSESRLMALRALAVGSFHDPSLRPTRIQARSFLDFVYRRPELSATEIALLLQVAKAYRFREEVQLLTRDLHNRIAAPAAAGSGFWQRSLAYLALEHQQPGQSVGRYPVIRALDALAAEGPRRGWEQVAGFLSLLAGYYWRGDFDHDGFAEIRVGEQAPLVVGSEPETGGRQLQRIALRDLSADPAAQAIRIDTTSALGTVIIAVIGNGPGAAGTLTPDWVNSQFLREYQVETLLRGPLERVADFDPVNEAAQIGDLLQLRIELNLAEPLPHTELRFPVPAGLAMDAEGIVHTWEGDAGDGGSPVNLRLVPQLTADPVVHTYRMERLPAGRHVFRLSYSAYWAGEFAWPEPRLILPRSGMDFPLGAAHQLVIEPAPGN
jgi:hypothetical protein